MKTNYYYDQEFTRIDCLAPGEYEQCRFEHCVFFEKDLSKMQFIDCHFEHCNFSMARLNKTLFREAFFKHCKMLGLQFNTCEPFGLSVSFAHCQLDHSSFYQSKLKQTIFDHCNLSAVDFTEADLTQAVFAHCDLSQARFERSQLSQADFRTAQHYQINPNLNTLKKAKFSLDGVAGLLAEWEIVLAP